MAADLTQEEFSRHVNTSFQVQLEGERLNLDLVEVKAYLPQPNEQAGMERFSVYFDGPGDEFLPQRLYHLVHEGMGEFDIFLVPISKNQDRFRYEAVFNYFKNPS